MPKKTDQPIKDTNGNGRLDSSELMALLNAEDVKPGTPAPVHDMLSFADFRALTKEYNSRVMTSEITTANEDAFNKEFAKDFAQNLTNTVNDLNRKRALDPNYLKKQIEPAIRARDTVLEHAPAEIDKSIEGARRMDVFARDFSKNFPNGIDISPDDVLKLMGHLGSMRVPSTPPATPKPKIRYYTT